MRASVVIPSFNRPELVVRTVRSLVVQTVPQTDYEVIVVDDHSDPPVTEAFAGHRIPRMVRIIRCEENRGRAGARNVGLRAASADVIVMLDDDMEVVPGFLEAHLHLHRIHPRAVVLGKIAAAPELGRDPFLRYLDSRGPEKVPAGAPVPSKYFVTGNCSLPLTALDEVGGFDEGFTFYGGEDTELGIRLGKAGFEILYEPAALAHHMDVAGIDRLCERLGAYGREALPEMVRRHPELKSLLSLDVLDPPRWGRESPLASLRRALFQASLRPGAFRFARALAGARFAGRALYPVYDYLRAYSYMTAYRDAVERGEAG
jgi:GT2 family glycosyltransferase